MNTRRGSTSCLARLALLCGAWVVASCAFAQSDWQVTGAERVVAVADVHGAYPALERILRRAGVIDDAGAWSGGTTHLVIVGDVLDRGPDSRQALDLIMRLEAQATAAGGRVHMVLGNHEIMNLTGDLRYVAPGEYAAFANDESGAMRDEAFARYLEVTAARGESAVPRAMFDEAFPSGYFAHRAAFSPDGAYGAWLLEQPLLLVVDGVAFVHGGLAEAVIRYGTALNETLSRDLAAYVESMDALIGARALLPSDSLYDHPSLLAAARERRDPGLQADGPRAAAERLDALQASDLFSPDGPLWYRGSVSCNLLTERDRFGAALAGLGADRLVVGHTPTPEALILSRMDDALLRVDTGMLHDYYGGRASALVIEGGRLSTLYEDEDRSSSPVPQARRVGLRPDDLSAEEIEAVLRRGEIELLGGFDSTASVVRVRDGRLELLGIFTRAEHAEVRPATAAYRLDRVLGLDMIPVTVARDDAALGSGSLQFLPEQSLNEIERREQGLGGSAWCPLADQFRDMTVFDLLIYNEARTAERIRYSADNLQLLLVGHDRTFAADRGRPAYLAAAEVTLTPAWRGALAGLDEASLTAVLGDVLDRRRIRALLVRRDALLEAAQ